MNVLAIIPARGGSKRLPGKNIRPLGGVPLIGWTINAAIESGVFRTVLVSTDDEEIAEVSRSFGALVPWLRPETLSTDTASSIDVVLHALGQVEKESGVRCDYAVLLQPTSPFRTSETIRAGVELCISIKTGAVVSVSPARTHPELCFKLDENRRMNKYCISHEKGNSLRSQDLSPAFEVNGALYVATPEYLRTYRTFFGPASTALVMQSPAESVDIDDEWDWALATWVASSVVSGNQN